VNLFQRKKIIGTLANANAVEVDCAVIKVKKIDSQMDKESLVTEAVVVSMIK